MNVTITPAKLAGAITPPPSKSQAHRLVIAAALGTGESTIENIALSQDIAATLRCVEALGASWEQVQPGTIRIRGLGTEGPGGGELPHLDCGESGSTLRFLIPVALMAFCPLIIAMNGEARLLSDYASLFAFFLMGCVFLAIGMFLSSLTESQIIAAVSTFAVLLILYLWDDLTGFLPSALGNLLSAFSFTQTFYNFVQYSMFDLGGVVLYLSLTGLFLFLTIQGLQKRRWS